MKRALAAEGVGSFFLFATVIGSGIMAEKLSGGNVAVALLGNAPPSIPWRAQVGFPPRSCRAM
jgi:hypothetical protein